MIRQLLWLLQAALFYCGTWLGALLPVWMVNRAGSMLGALMYRLLPRRRRIAEQNISQSLAYMRSQPGWNSTISDAQGITRELFRNLGRSLIEVCQLYHGRGDALIDRIEIRGREHFNAARAKGKGMIFLAGHCANWELGALGYGRILQIPVAVVARRQDNPHLNRMVERMRMRYDNRVIYKDNALKQMLAVIKANGIVGILADQAVTPDQGCLIHFMGRPAWATKAPVLLARRTGAVVVPVFGYRDGNRLVLEVHPELVFSTDSSEAGLTADVQLYSNMIEQFVVSHPTDWYWVHRRWKRTEGLPDAAATV